jgi:hypothetical protein
MAKKSPAPKTKPRAKKAKAMPIAAMPVVEAFDLNAIDLVITTNIPQLNDHPAIAAHLAQLAAALNDQPVVKAALVLLASQAAQIAAPAVPAADDLV